MSARKLRVVPNCPQPEPPPFKQVKYGPQRCPLKPKGTPITANPAPRELHAIMFSQSARTKAGARAEPWSYADSVANLNKAARVSKHNVTVPQPLCQPARELPPTPPPVRPARAGSLPQRDPAARVGSPADASPNPAPVEVQATGVHSSPCDCHDDAQRHYALIARDLMQQGRESELTDDMRQAYDYEFGGVPEPEACQVPEL